MKALITGCGRSGTKFAAHELTSRNIVTRHEGSGRHAISSWCLAACKRKGELLEPIALPPWHHEVDWYDSYPLIAHLVRNPLDAIASATTISPAAWQWIAQHIELDPDASPLRKAVTYWVRWNQMAEALADFRVNVESVKLAPGSKRVNARNHRKVTWFEIYDEHTGHEWDDLCEGAWHMAERYGYGVGGAISTGVGRGIAVSKRRKKRDIEVALGYLGDARTRFQWNVNDDPSLWRAALEIELRLLDAEAEKRTTREK